LIQISDILPELRSRLTPFSQTPLLDAQVLLGHVLGRTRTWVLAHPEAHLTSDQEHALIDALTRLEADEPLPYILGQWEFYGLDFFINPDTLIPRPDTELLVEQALSWSHTRTKRLRAADIGTGSGCIAISLALNASNVHVLGCDISLTALQVARANAHRHMVSGKVDFVQCNLLPPVKVQFDLICANLPYIPTETLHSLKVYQREPELALDGGVDGLGQIRRLLNEAEKVLAPGGLLLLEIEASSGAAVHLLAREAFPKADVQVLPDLAGRDRLVNVLT
jgi:release factor glutamine methyltransferase